MLFSGTFLVLSLAHFANGVIGFKVQQHLGGNGRWFPGPNINNISPDPPSSCSIDQVIYVSRHGSRYPDPGAFTQWEELYGKIRNASFTAHSSLSFIPTWNPPKTVPYPSQQTAMLSLTGYKELNNLGTRLRWRYPTFYEPNTAFTVWSNDYARTIDSARLFARGFMGPNATSLGRIVVVNADIEANGALGNSLGPSDQCPNYSDDYTNQTDIWDAEYLPPITKRLNALIKGDLEFDDTDVSIFPYLCGFESQILGTRSPWCSVFTDQEILEYEYHQDLRYWYGTGLGTDIEWSMMLPFLQQVVQLLFNGPSKSYTQSDGSEDFTPGPLVVAFTHDGQINQLAAVLGIYDNEPDLDPSHMDPNRLFKTSHFDTMRGTIAFERLSCESEKYVRLRLNDAVYPVSSCQNGPGRSCALSDYKKLLAKKVKKMGNWALNCGVENATASTTVESTFLMDLGLGWISFESP